MGDGIPMATNWKPSSPIISGLSRRCRTRRLLAESRIPIPAQPNTTSPTVSVNPRVNDAAVDEHLSKTIKSRCFVLCSEDGRTCMPFARSSKAATGVMSCLGARLEGGPVGRPCPPEEGGQKDQEHSCL